MGHIRYLLCSINHVFKKILSIINNEPYNECIWCKHLYKKKKKFFKCYNPFCSKSCMKKYNEVKNQVFKKNNRCYLHKGCTLTYKNMCWQCYKRAFMSNTPKVRLNLFFKMKLCLNGFHKIPTFRTSKDSWNGDKIAFEQHLKDKHIKWFVYIKFYEVKKGNKILSKPIVIGKSGSSLVNASGSDLNFSVRCEDGPARRFLYCNKLKWNYDFIYVKKCFSEKSAYTQEQKYMDEYSLYGS